MRQRQARSPRTLAAVGEFSFLRSILSSRPDRDDIAVGPGDDCAVVVGAGLPILLTIDSLVEGVHFERAWLGAAALGRRAVMVNASDIAAMGGRPRWLLIDYGAPTEFSATDLRAVQRGIVAGARSIGASVTGGNLTRASRLSISIAMVGECRFAPVLRSGARPGDAIYVSGTLGDAALAVRDLLRGQRPAAALLRRYRAPQARVAAGELLAKSACVTAMIDVSDGLLQDARHLCRSSGVGAELDSRALPLSRAYRRVCGDDVSAALTGGEDYELLFTVPAKLSRRFARLRDGLDCAVTRIGAIVARRGIRVDGRDVADLAPGFDHFGGGRLQRDGSSHRREGRS